MVDELFLIPYLRPSLKHLASLIGLVEVVDGGVEHVKEHVVIIFREGALFKAAWVNVVDFEVEVGIYMFA